MCCIRNILLLMQHTGVAYATKCCICNTKMQMSQMQQDVRYAAYMCCKCNKMFGILITCTVLVTYLVICLKTTWLSKSSIQEIQEILKSIHPARGNYVTPVHCLSLSFSLSLSLLLSLSVSLSSRVNLKASVIKVSQCA